MAKPFVWYRGATFRMALEVASGAVTGAEPVRCALRRAIGAEPVGDELMEFAVTFVASDGDLPSRWEITGTAEDGLDLEPGQYVLDARIEAGGDVVISKSAAIVVKATATPT
jgi:hypothetical protein